MSAQEATDLELTILEADALPDLCETEDCGLRVAWSSLWSCGCAVRFCEPHFQDNLNRQHPDRRGSAGVFCDTHGDDVEITLIVAERIS